MAYHQSVSFHGVSKIEVGKIATHERRSDKSWQAVTLWLYDADGKLQDSITFHSDDGATLTVVHD
jgi:hypothetical protein